MFQVQPKMSTAYSGANLRSGPDYWELSGPTPVNRCVSCRACKQTIYKNSSVYTRTGRKLRFFYHENCFSGSADPRTQKNGAFTDSKHIYHKKTAPNVSGLEGLMNLKISTSSISLCVMIFMRCMYVCVLIHSKRSSGSHR